jgi:hypothetical protein
MAEKRKRSFVIDDSEDAESGQDEEEDEPLPAKMKRAKKPTLKKSMTGEMFIHVPNLNVDCQFHLDKENIESEAKKLTALKKQVAKLRKKLKDSDEPILSKGNATHCCHILILLSIYE